MDEKKRTPSEEKGARSHRLCVSFLFLMKWVYACINISIMHIDLVYTMFCDTSFSADECAVCD